MSLHESPGTIRKASLLAAFFVLVHLQARKAPNTYLGAGLGCAAACVQGLSTLHSGKRLVGTALEIVPSLCEVLSHGADEGKSEAALALSSLLDMNPEVDKALYEFAGVTSLVFAQPTVPAQPVHTPSARFSPTGRHSRAPSSKPTPQCPRPFAPATSSHTYHP